MRLLFDAYWWAKGPLANQIVLREFIHSWLRTFPEDEIVLAIRNTHKAVAVVPAGVQVVHTLLRPQAAANALELPLLAKHIGADSIIVHNYTPIFGDSLVFIHDLLFEDHPEWFTFLERLYFYPMSRLARRARVVTTSSATEARRIERLHPGLAPVHPVGLGVSTALSNSSPSKPAGLDQTDGFVVSVGRLNRRKNLAIVIEGAMKSVGITRERPLVVVGSGQDSGLPADLPIAVQDYVESGRLVFLGRVTNEELRWIYEHADCLIYLSRDEGFGLPPLEAAYFGTPSIVSDTTVMREVAQDAIAFVNPDSAEDLTKILNEDVVGRPELKHQVWNSDIVWNECVVRIRSALTLRRDGGSPR